MNRRSFFASLIQPPNTSASKMTMRTGPRGEKISVLGYGGMRWPLVDGTIGNNSGGEKLDKVAIAKLIDYAIEHGVTYFDSSPVYCQGYSEAVMGEALSRHPREKYQLATKLSNFASKLHTFEESKKMYEKSFKDLRTPYIDFYLLHSIGGGGKNSMNLFNQRFIDNGMLDFLLKEREAKRIRNLGFSFHGDVKVFDHAMKLHDKVHWDFAMIQMNYVDWKHAAENGGRNVNAEYLYNELTKRGIKVCIMEPLLGGRLAKFNYNVAQQLVPLDPSASLASWAFRFCASHPNVLTVLSGMVYMEHLEENVKTLSPLKPLTEKEFEACEKAAVAFLKADTIPCNLCEYCMPCPYGIDIPRILDCWNRNLVDDKLPVKPRDADYMKKARNFLIDYDRSVPKLRRANRCTGCGICNPHCPQSIDIPAQIRMIDEFVEKLRGVCHA